MLKSNTETLKAQYKNINNEAIEALKKCKGSMIKWIAGLTVTATALYVGIKSIVKAKDE